MIAMKAGSTCIMQRGKVEVGWEIITQDHTEHHDIIKNHHHAYSLFITWWSTYCCHCEELFTSRWRWSETTHQHHHHHLHQHHHHVAGVPGQQDRRWMLATAHRVPPHHRARTQARSCAQASHCSQVCHLVFLFLPFFFSLLFLTVIVIVATRRRLGPEATTGCVKCAHCHHLPAPPAPPAPTSSPTSSPTEEPAEVSVWEAQVTSSEAWVIYLSQFQSHVTK